MSQTLGKLEARAHRLERGAAEPGKLIVFDLRRLTRWSEERPYVQVLADIGTARLLLFAFKAGQQLQEHRTSSQILVQALRGRLIFTAAGSTVTLHAGMVLQLEANVAHTVVAQTDAILLLTLVPSPVLHSLEGEVFQGLTPLVTRTVRAAEEAGEKVPAASLTRVAEEGVAHQEVSHVFHCMECGLEFQMDLEVASHEGSPEIDAGVMRVRLDPRIRLERAAALPASND